MDEILEMIQSDLHKKGKQLPVANYNGRKLKEIVCVTNDKENANNFKFRNDEIELAELQLAAQQKEHSNDNEIRTMTQDHHESEKHAAEEMLKLIQCIPSNGNEEANRTRNNNNRIYKEYVSTLNDLIDKWTSLRLVGDRERKKSND